jgi:hypothetical protein
MCLRLVSSDSGVSMQGWSYCDLCTSHENAVCRRTNPLRVSYLCFQMYWDLIYVNVRRTLFASVKCRWRYPWCIRYYFANFDVCPKYLEEINLEVSPSYRIVWEWLWRRGHSESRLEDFLAFSVAKTHTVAHSCYPVVLVTFANLISVK